ncbi:MAG: hypothetical protein QXS79_06020 [Candidatus Bathyarchaeia archaeon]
METYEYIFAAIVMIAILLAAIFLTGISPPLYRSMAEVEQLKMVAQKIMTQMLLSPGEPEDWGENITIRSENLSSFGLAVSTFFTREAFVLDPNKVQRLSQNLPAQLYIPPERVLELLNLGSSETGFDYGIKIEFIPALNVTLRSGLNNVNVSVVSEQSMPAANAKVTVGAISFDGNGGLRLSQSSGKTDGGGNCALNLTFSSSSLALLVAAVDHYGVQRVVVENVGSVINAHFIGNFLIMNSSYQIDADNGAYQIFLAKFPNSSFSVGIAKYGLELASGGGINNYSVYNMSGVEPYAIAVVALTNNNNLVVSWKDIPRSYGFIAGEVYPPSSYMLERSVRIGLSTYTVRLRVWRMSW